MESAIPDPQLPDGAVPTACLLVMLYIDSSGDNSYVVATKGDAPATSYLGMTVIAQQDILTWGGISS